MRVCIQPSPCRLRQAVKGTFNSSVMHFSAARNAAMCRRHQWTHRKNRLAANAAQGPRVTQTAVMSAVFFTLFEFWKAQLKGPGARDSHDRYALWLGPPQGFKGRADSEGGHTVAPVNAPYICCRSFPLFQRALNHPVHLDSGKG